MKTHRTSPQPLRFQDEKLLIGNLEKGLELLDPGQPALKIMRMKPDDYPSSCMDNVDDIVYPPEP